MSKKFTKIIRFAAIVSVATTMGATGALAGSKPLSAEIMAINYSVQAQQAVSRKNVMAMVNKARALGVSPLTVAKLNHGTATVRPGSKKDLMELARNIQAQQAVRRAALMDMIETARSLNVSPLTFAQMEQGSLDIAVSNGPSDD